MNRQFLLEYAQVYFDCDGVLLNSNRIKTEAFYRVARPFGKIIASEFVKYHIHNAGVSRYEKFRWLLSKLPSASNINLELLLDSYGKLVVAAMDSVEVATGLDRARAAYPEQIWYVISGSDQNELRRIFNNLGIAEYFDGGIFGSPRDKSEILGALNEKRIGAERGCFVGDSAYDLQVATEFGFDFTFVSGWSEWAEGFSVCSSKSIPVVSSVSEFFFGPARQ